MNNKLGKNETLLKGQAIFKDGKFLPDPITARIDYLKENVLREVATCNEGWNILYIDDSDGRYWELFYADGNWKSEGPPSLQYISEEEAKIKYNL